MQQRGAEGESGELKEEQGFSNSTGRSQCLMEELAKWINVHGHGAVVEMCELGQ